MATGQRNTRLQNVNGGHSGTLAFYFCPFWGHAGKSPGHAGKTIFLWSIFNKTIFCGRYLIIIFFVVDI